MAPVVTLIQQRIIHYGGYEDLKNAGSENPLEEYTKFTKEFGSSKNAVDAAIESPYGKENGGNDDIVEVDDQEQITGKYSAIDDNAELLAGDSPHSSVDLDDEDEDEDEDMDEDGDEDEDMDDEGEQEEEGEQEDEGDEEMKEVI